MGIKKCHNYQSIKSKIEDKNSLLTQCLRSDNHVHNNLVNQKKLVIIRAKKRMKK